MVNVSGGGDAQPYDSETGSVTTKGPGGGLSPSSWCRVEHRVVVGLALEGI